MNEPAAADRVEELKARAGSRIDEWMPKLKELSLLIHGWAELAYEEHQSAKLLADFLEEQGFSLTRKAAGLDTAFAARSGSGGPHLGFISEYDALPGIGHGCGHNLIAITGAGAGLALQDLQQSGLLPGSVSVFGTPAEEGGGGKIRMLEKGVFDGVDAAMMVHPAPINMPDTGSLAVIPFQVEFHGKSAHAAANPELGVNALEAIIQTFVLINALRQHIPSDQRIHGIITHGGEAANVVPEYTRGEFMVRSPDMARVEATFEKIKACVAGAATATGCTFQLTQGTGYREMNPNPVLRNLFDENMARLGRGYLEGFDPANISSTDMGDISQALPAIHPYLGMDVPDFSWHAKTVHAAAVTDSAWQMAADGAKALVFTAIDVLATPGKLDEVKAAFSAARNK
jgi:amidohydrolase